MLQQLHKLVGVILCERFVYFPLNYLFNQLLNHASLLIIWIREHLVYTLDCNPILLYFITQIAPAWVTESSFGWLLQPVNMPHYFDIFEPSLTFWHYRIQNMPHSWNLPFLQGALGPLVGEWYQKPGSVYGKCSLQLGCLGHSSWKVFRN